MAKHYKLDQNLAWMYGLSRFGIKMGLEVMESILEELGNPHEETSYVHITGTNGKGSTAAMIASALRAGGWKTGLYTSPHLFVFNERIRVNGKPISDGELLQLIDEVKRAVQSVKVQPTFFEFTTAVALLYFAKQRVDLAVLEVGMGGLLDATNVITPEVSIITNIGLDHTQILGQTKQEIAKRKAGIIKPGVPVVTADKDEEIIDLLSEVAAQNHATFYQAGKYIWAREIDHSWRHQTFVTTGLMAGRFVIPLLGDHQITNALTAMIALHILGKGKFPVAANNVKKGFELTVFPGRMDVVSMSPFVLVDGAHNSDGVEVLSHFIRKEKLHFDVLVVALKAHKDPADIINKILPHVDNVIVTEGVYDPEPADHLVERISDYYMNRENDLSHGKVAAVVDPKAAVARALHRAGPNGKVLITGSLYMIPEALAVFSKGKVPVSQFAQVP